jgi:hypothetical protein
MNKAEHQAIVEHAIARAWSEQKLAEARALDIPAAPLALELIAQALCLAFPALLIDAARSLVTAYTAVVAGAISKGLEQQKTGEHPTGSENVLSFNRTKANDDKA